MDSNNLILIGDDMDPLNLASDALGDQDFAYLSTKDYKRLCAAVQKSGIPFYDSKAGDNRTGIYFEDKSRGGWWYLRKSISQPYKISLVMYPEYAVGTVEKYAINTELRDLVKSRNILLNKLTVPVGDVDIIRKHSPRVAKIFDDMAEELIELDQKIKEATEAA